MARNDEVERSTMKTYGIITALDASNKQSITNVKPAATTTTPLTKAKYVVTECYNIVRNMFVEPEYTELYITSKAWTKLMCFIHLVGEYEITGFGRIQENVDTPNGPKRAITDFDIIEQEVKQAYVEADADAVLDFMRKLPADQRGEWTLDWHSHVNMGVSPSGTDWTNYSSMLSARMNKQFPAMIVNKRGDVSMHCIITSAKHPEIKVYIIQENLNDEDFSAIYYECKEKVENLCTKYVAPATTYTYGSNWYKSNDSAYKGTACGYDYDKRWWEEDAEDDVNYPKTGSLLGNKSLADEDEEAKAAREAGYILDDDGICPYCGLPVRETDETYKQWGVCEDCMAEYEADTGERFTSTSSSTVQSALYN